MRNEQKRLQILDEKKIDQLEVCLILSTDFNKIWQRKTQIFVLF